MENTSHRAIAIVGVGAVLPDAPNVASFWKNIKDGRYSISEVIPSRWDSALYFDSDHSAPDKTYSKLGGWVREHVWEPIKWHLPIPPRVVDAMDESQKWAIACTREALEDYGYPQRPLDNDRTAVILGNAMAGEKHYFTVMRVLFPEYARELTETASFAALPEAVRREIMREVRNRMGKLLPEITEDSMPGELANCIAGRIANVFNFHGPNYVCDAACASAMAALNSAAQGLVEHQFDVAVTGGIDRNMGVSTFVKFCKIGALSATGTRPYAEGADGFVMGEGAAIFVLKRLADAEQNKDRIYAVLRGMGGSSDGKGKGITAPNPVGQKFAIERAWQNAGLSPSTATLIEGHGTSTRVGDVVEVQSLIDVLRGSQLPAHSVALGSVKSNFGHLKGAAGAAGLLKTVLALRDQVLPPSIHCEHSNPDIDFAHSPLYVNTELKPWTMPENGPRRAGLSAFGFGGTNFHAVLEEYIPGRLNGNGKHSIAVSEIPPKVKEPMLHVAEISSTFDSSYNKAPLRGALLIGAAFEAALVERLLTVEKDAKAGRAPAPTSPAMSDLRAPERLAIDYANAAELADKAANAIKALAANQPAMWKALRAQGIFRGHGPAPKVAFLYTGQGSQYANMLHQLRATEPIVAETFAEADRVMTPLLGKPLSKFIFVDQADSAAIAKAEEDLRQTEITQPAVLAIDFALTRLLAAYGVEPDFTMGHSLGEYGALVAAGALPFADSLEAVSARGRGMTQVAMEDNGRMAAVFAPLEEVERILKTIEGYVVIANVNSNRQAVIGGASKAVEQAMEVFQRAGYDVSALPVSHAFHTTIVAGASKPLRQVLERLHLASPRLPIVANTTGEFYPTGPDAVPQMLDILTRQVASPVQFVRGLRTLYDAGARVFVEVGPKKALQGFAEDVLGGHSDVVSLFTNHPKVGDIVAFNQALCGLYAAGLGRGIAETLREPSATTMPNASSPAETFEPTRVAPPATLASIASGSSALATPANGDRFKELGHLLADVLDRGYEIYFGQKDVSNRAPVVITGAALGLPGTEHIFDDANIGRILRGEQFIESIPTRFRRAMLDKHITRLVKSENGEARFETISDVAEVIKLAGRGGDFNLEDEFGIAAERVGALDRVTQLAIAAGIDALRDAGVPLVMRYRTTTKGTQLPERWGLPEALRDDTGVIFASAFPGYDSFADEMARYYADHERREQLTMLENLLLRAVEANGNSIVVQDINRRIDELRASIKKEPYVFNRRFLLRVLSMGHSQFAEFIGARGPNTQVNAACASTTQAVALAEDWIHAERCNRVIVISADDVTSDHLIDWMGAGFLASGAAATDEMVADAAIPFDRRRHGMIIGMGAAALVVESAKAARERGIQPICEVLSTTTNNSAFHGTRLDVQHIGQVMEALIAKAESRSGISRQLIAPQTVFVSHETYTPARGGSASAEIHALRHVFGNVADRIVIANTKGFTGHAMGTGIEDVVAVKALETGCVPPVANFKEVDPELGPLNLSKGGAYPVEYALHLGAGFGSQISMMLLRWTKTKDGIRRSPGALGYSYRIVDPNAWSAWLTSLSGRPDTDLEVVHRTLRVRDQRLVTRVSETTQESPAAVAKAPVPTRTQQARPPATVVTPIPAPLRAVTEPAPKVEVAPTVSSVLPKPAAKVDSVKERVLTLVAEKTGYPVDMLDLDLDLEADLGVDTVKQAEVFASIREAYNIARDENRKLRDYPTLAHVIRFVYEKRPDLAAAQAPAREEVKLTTPKTAVLDNEPAPAATSAKDEAGDSVKERVLALVVEKTGYPKDMLDLELDLEADLGVDTVKQAELFAAIRELYNIARDENRKLRDYPTLAHVIRFVYEKRPDLAGMPTAEVSPTISAPIEPAPVAVAAQAAPDDSIKAKVLEIVAEKSGYPKEMLDLDLDLEADLGIDTVKQAEMFAAVRAAYNIPRDENLKLRDFPTLAHVIKFAHDRQPSVAKVPAASSSAAQEKQEPTQKKQAVSVSSTLPPIPVDLPIPASFDAANRIPRRAPVPNLRPPLALCKPSGVTLGSGRRVVLMPDKSGVGSELLQRLEAMGVEVLCLNETLDADALKNRIENWLTAGPVHGVYWLPALDNEGDLRRMDLATWKEALRVRVKSLYITMRGLYEQVAEPGTFLVSATRLGGQHGYDEAGAQAPLGGAVAGFTKTYKRERLDTLVKAVDFEAERNPAEVADLLIAETQRDPGAIEIGYKQGLRWTVGLQEEPATDGDPGITLDRDTVFLVTGAAGSIVSAITADLATASGGTFYLLDLVPEPDPANPDLQRFVTDKEGLKRDLFARIQMRGERATPALVEKELAALERAQAAHNAIAAVRAVGGIAHYFSVNLTDAAAVAKIIQEVRERSGHIDVLLHAAGTERSHSLPDKDPREFDLVFDVKSDGWFNLLHAIGDMPLGATVAFSSIAGRFGNAGQSDYSSANDLLCKITSSFRTTRPDTRGIVIDWTAWGGIGMATRGSIPKMMEIAGIDMLAPEAGIPLIRRELTAGGTRGEIVIGQRLGILMNEWDATGGLDASAVEASRNLPVQGPMIGKVASMAVLKGLKIETTLDPVIQPFLHDHQIDGTPVLPGVMGIEAFAEAALCLLPGWQVAAIEDVNFLAPFKFYRNEPRIVTVEANIHPQGDTLLAECRLSGTRSLPNLAEPQVTTHFTARVRLTKHAPQAVPVLPPGLPNGHIIESADIYRLYFHGPAYQVVERAWSGGDQIFGQMAKGLPSNHFPPEKRTLMAPRLIELCFQTAGLWEMGTLGRMGLPQHIRQVSLLRAPDPGVGDLYAVVTPNPEDGSFDADVVDVAGNRYLQLIGYRTVALPHTVDTESLKGLQAVAA
jgi:acyl transferase domain-containing protein/NAD(P)-dependent dehydrogenase (short-subunit alcohol dehydrogenase family)/acyl carrier protein